MKKVIYIIIAIIIIIAAVAVIRSQPTKSGSSTVATFNDMVKVTSPANGATITSPVTVVGEARGNWFFEASFPVVVVDWDGRIIGQGVAQAKGEWMTTDFVPFEATVSFDKPADAGAQSTRGSIILKNDNPSDQAKTAKSVEIPVVFQ